MGIIVQKFGGTSLATLKRRNMVVEKIVKARKNNHLVVVVSAIGRKNEPYSTDALLGLLNGMEESIVNRELDLLLSCGEVISGVLLAGLLQNQGLKAVCLTGAQAGIVTDNTFGSARIIKVKPETILEFISKGYIVVVAGFQGITEDREITTLGRGGSDTTAAALGVALNADVIEIYTDVNGLKTADPKIVEEARTLDKVTYNEICQLAYEGARVIHPRAVEIAMQGNIPIRLKSAFTNEPGTLITNRILPYEETQIKGDRLITGIAQITDISQLSITHTRVIDENIKQNLFDVIAKNNISIDFINVFPGKVVFTVPDSIAEKAVNLISGLDLQVKVRPGCAKVATVGAGMTGVPGVMARIVGALNKQNIRILQSADSYTTIWCLVDNKDMQNAIKALHREFGLG
ncbi:MAG: aspartate kinase [Clostridia bacterium]|nr:aspartate kinase [Clostridia bacterium]